MTHRKNLGGVISAHVAAVCLYGLISCAAASAEPLVYLTVKSFPMPVTPELHAQILRYYHVERWRVGTIARQLQKLGAAVDQSSGIDSAKVASIQASIANGSYKVDSQAVANALLATQNEAG